MKKVLIIGAGFGGLFAAKELEKYNFETILLDKNDHHVFQPLLYQVASGFLPISNVVFPIRELINAKKTKFYMTEVIRIDPGKKTVITKDKIFIYDFLIIAAGAKYTFFNRPEWSQQSFVLKSIEDAIKLRDHILTCFEQAELTENETEKRKLLNFVVVGGGPTGVEISGAISDMAHTHFIKQFSSIKPENIKVQLIESSEHVLSSFPIKLTNYAKNKLIQKEIDVKTNCRVKNITEGCVDLNNEKIMANTIIWAAGVEPIGAHQWFETETDNRGRIKVDKHLQAFAHQNIFVIGDSACCLGKNNQPLPGLASVAKQQGKYIGKYLYHKSQGKVYREFCYRDFGTMSTIGKNAAIAQFGKISVKGSLAWYLWGIVHIYFLIGLRSRFFVFINWIISYLFKRLGERFILFNKSPNKNL